MSPVAETPIPFADVPLPETPFSFAPRFVFGIHKSGSTLLSNMLEDILKAARIPYVNPARVMFQRGVQGADWGADPGFRDLIKPGLIYTGFRLYPQALSHEQLGQGRSVLLVRDPRDALVSGFFSFGPKGSHVLPNKSLRHRVEKAQARETGLTIDDWVLRRVPRVAEVLAAYAAIRDVPGLRVWRYEDIFFDKLGFVREMTAHLDLDVADRILVRMARRHDVRPRAEDPGKHIRKGTPGDHRDKLQPATIATLNTRLADVMQAFGYTAER